MIKIAVTKISCLLGKHPFKTSSETITEIRKRKKRTKWCESSVEKKLRQTSFYSWFTRARVITNRMRKISRSIVNKVCKEHNIKFNKPYNYFAKERGIVQEPLCIRRLEELFDKKVTGQQKRLCEEISGYQIVDAIDGLCEIDNQQTVVEVKCRSCILKNTPCWELIQLKVYCYLMQLPGILVEFQGNDIKQTKITLKEANASFKNEIEPKLTEVINEFLLPKKSDERD